MQFRLSSTQNKIADQQFPLEWVRGGRGICAQTPQFYSLASDVKFFPASPPKYVITRMKIFGPAEPKSGLTKARNGTLAAKKSQN